MTQDEDMFDPEKPYARFYSDDTCIAQIHTRAIENLGFGRVGWRITASESDETGAAKTDGDGEFLILRAPNGELMQELLIIQAETTVDIPVLLEEARTRMAERVAVASAMAASAAAIT
jgi:hypothetical protein